MKDVSSAFAGLAIMLLLIIYGMASIPFVAMKYYEWFIDPVFHLPYQFTLVHFVGFKIFVEIMTIGQMPDRIKDEYKKKSETSALLVAPIFLLLGYIFHYLFPI